MVRADPKKKVTKQTNAIMDASMTVNYGPIEAKRRLLDDSIGKIAELKAFQEKDDEKPLKVTGKKPKPVEKEIDPSKKKCGTKADPKKKVKKMTKGIMDASMTVKYGPDEVIRGLLDDSIGKIADLKAFGGEDREKPLKVTDKKPEPVEKEIDPSKKKRGVSTGNTEGKKSTRSKSKYVKVKLTEQELIDLST